MRNVRQPRERNVNKGHKHMTLPTLKSPVRTRALLRGAEDIDGAPRSKKASADLLPK